LRVPRHSCQLWRVKPEAVGVFHFRATSSARADGRDATTSAVTSSGTGCRGAARGLGPWSGRPGPLLRCLFRRRCIQMRNIRARDARRLCAGRSARAPFHFGHGHRQSIISSCPHAARTLQRPPYSTMLFRSRRPAPNRKEPAADVAEDGDELPMHQKIASRLRMGAAPSCSSSRRPAAVMPLFASSADALALCGRHCCQCPR